MTEHAHKI